MITLTDAEYDGLKARIAALEAELAAAQEELRVCQQEAITAHKRVAELEEWQRKRTTITGQVIDETVKLDARIAELEAQIHAAGLPCDCWDSRCTQYAILLRRASFLMQTASQGDADMRKFIAEVERLVGSPSSSDKLSTPPSLSDATEQPK